MPEPEYAPTSPVPVGERFGRFTLLECIGRGGMAEVFRAVTEGVEGFRRVFVVKRIPKEKSANQGLIDMFVNEARISALLNHPNIVQIYDFGQIEGSYFLSMEYLHGKDLLLVLRQLRAADRVMPPAVAAHIAREVANGLGYAHHLSQQGGKALNIIHRDVSPSNVMLLRTGGVKLLDFGIAKAETLLHHDVVGHTTQNGLVKGKLSYLSPEQVRNEPLDSRSDIFSLGVVLWECLTGKRLFHDRADYHTMNNVLERPIPPPSTQRPDIAPALDLIVMRALERGKDQRYETAKTMAADLDSHLGDCRFSPNSVSLMLEELFGTDAMEIETLPAARIALPPGDDEKHQTPLSLPRSWSDAIPAISRSAVSLAQVKAPHNRGWRDRFRLRPGMSTWPWLVGAAALMTGAFLAGVVVRSGPRASATTEEGAVPAAEDPSATVSVRIESDPAGAAVRTESRGAIGATPVVTNLPRGDKPLVLIVEKDGFETHRQTLTPDRDITAFVSLRPLPAEKPPVTTGP